MDPAWCDLPIELLGLVLLYLPCIMDRVHFGAVCRAWRSAQRQRPAPPQLPWLLLPSATTPVVFSLLSRTAHRISLPDDALSARCYSSFGRWLFLGRAAGTAGGGGGVYFMLDLLSSARVPLPDVVARYRDTRDLSVRAAAVSSEPTADSCIVAAITDDNSLALWRPGMASWSGRNHHDPLEEPRDEFILFKGKLRLDGLYSINSQEEVLVWALLNEGPRGEPYSPYAMSYYAEQREGYAAEQERNRRESVSTRRYLVQSRGELLMVLRYYSSATAMDGNAVTPRTRSFRVYKNEDTTGPFGPGNSRWVERHDLVGEAIFVGRGCSTSLPASPYHGLQGDSIYFIDGDVDTPVPEQSNGRRVCCNVGVYSMESGDVVSSTPVELPPSCAAPTWYFFSKEAHA